MNFELNNWIDSRVKESEEFERKGKKYKKVFIVFMHDKFIAMYSEPSHLYMTIEARDGLKIEEFENYKGRYLKVGGIKI